MSVEGDDGRAIAAAAQRIAPQRRIQMVLAMRQSEKRLKRNAGQRRRYSGHSSIRLSSGDLLHVDPVHVDPATENVGDPLSVRREGGSTARNVLADIGDSDDPVAPPVGIGHMQVVLTLVAMVVGPEARTPEAGIAPEDDLASSFRPAFREPRAWPSIVQMALCW